MANFFDKYAGGKPPENAAEPKENFFGQYANPGKTNASPGPQESATAAPSYMNPNRYAPRPDSGSGVAKDAAVAAGVSGGLSATGVGMMAAAPFTGPAAPAMEAIGGLLAAAPWETAALSAVTAAGSSAVRAWGKANGYQKYTDKIATAIDLGGPSVISGLSKGIMRAGIGEHLLRPTPDTVEPVIRPLMEKADRMGLHVDHENVKIGADRVPVVPKKMAEHNQKRVNELATQAAGVPGEHLDQAWFKAANMRFKNEFGEIYNPKNVFIMPPAGVDVLADQLAKEMALGTPTANARVIGVIKGLLGDKGKDIASLMQQGVDGEAIKALLKAHTVSIPGDALQRVRASLQSVEGPEGYSARQIVRAIDGAVEATDPVIAKRLAILRPQYRAYIDLEDLAKTGRLEHGQLNASELGEHLAKDPGTIRGDSSHPLADLGQVGRELKIHDIHAHTRAAQSALNSNTKFDKTAASAGAVLGYGAGAVLGHSGPGAVIGGAVGGLGKAAASKIGKTVEDALGPVREKIETTRAGKAALSYLKQDAEKHPVERIAKSAHAGAAAAAADQLGLGNE